MVKWSNLGESRCAVRVSEYESLATALSLSGKIEWVWLDCFTHFPINHDEFAQLKSAGFKTCLVSPELQVRDSDVAISDMHNLLCVNNIVVDAICTKKPELWKALEVMK